jgi:hypothetical protein
LSVVSTVRDIREEKALFDVAEPGLILPKMGWYVRTVHRRLTANDGDDRTRDEVPIFIEGKRNDGLNEIVRRKNGKLFEIQSAYANRRQQSGRRMMSRFLALGYPLTD